MDYRIEYEQDGNWLAANCDFPDCGLFDTKAAAQARAAELAENNDGVAFRVVEC